MELFIDFFFEFRDFYNFFFIFELMITETNCLIVIIVFRRYAEEAQHQYGKEPTTLKTGHFTQVVWKDSTELGVGMARNRNGEVYVVCNYNPAGNFLGSFTENVLPPGGSSPSKKISFLPRYTMDDQAWQQEALLVHNEYRRRHRVPDLRLNAELTAAAKVS